MAVKLERETEESYRGMSVEPDDDIEGFARLAYAIALVVQVGYFFVWMGASVYVALSVSLVAGLATLVGGYLVGSLPVFAVTAESVFVTDKDPETVRAELGRLDSMGGYYLVAWADEIYETTADEGRHYELRQSFLGLIDRQLAVDVEDSDETGIAFHIGDREEAVRILVHGDGGETTVRVRGTNDRARPRHVLTILLQAPIEGRLWERRGYREVSSSFDVGI